MKERIAIVEGVRTPYVKVGGQFKGFTADDLGALAVKELMIRTGFPVDEVDELILGNAVQPVEATNIARIVGLKAGLPNTLPAYTVQRNCASGMECITTATNKILAGEAEVIIAGSAESMTHIPFMYRPEMVAFFTRLSRAKTLGQKLKTFLSFKLRFLSPIIGLEKGLTDPVIGMIMGLTAELLAREFHIGREEQDKYALLSHQRAAAATKAGKFLEEIIPVPIPPKYKSVLAEDDGIRGEQSMEALGKLRPYFDRVTGTVTAGNSSQVTDGAAAVLVMTESKAKKLGLKPMGYLRDYTYVALEGERMGLGPVFATSKLLEKTGMAFDDFDLVELNEAFAVQAIACQKAFGSDSFAKERLGRDKAIGELAFDRMNVNGGAIAFGHPVGSTGTRLVITLLKELARRNKNTGLATLCIGGGQGVALVLERE